MGVVANFADSKRFTYPHTHYTICDSLMRYAEFLGYGETHIKIDQKTGLKAIIAIHNLKRGPAIGGCRMVAYSHVDKAMEDALRLGYMMSFKAAINNLPHGGAKAVLIKPPVIKDREAYFEKFGEFVHELGGRYITAIDSGTNMTDMDIVAKRTPYVTCTTKQGGDEDPSPMTAIGVLRAIEAAVKFKLHRDSLAGVHVAIQGAGHVGYWLAKDLHERGARLTMADINLPALQICVEQFGATICPPEAIYDVEADVFAPCALGSVLNRDTIKRLRVPIVAGSANNQLAHRHYGSLLHERDILYAPDFLINAGGLIHVAVLYDHGDIQRSLQQIDQIYETVYDIFERAAHENRSTNDIAEAIALERLK
ncbi:MAG TPA: Glu/Leu/Phe/Val dehydrogenase dimerization domain-containing protein [Gammaproteobacteria bacterium]|jgi:leucine dehydrogenase|nr:Glu/Leu/Phe/Val dehydrogenase dimerization domain-containing protein [Gammaproteobacteria bacterium]